MNKLAKTLLLAAATILLTVHSMRADEPDQPTQTIFKNLMAAVAANDYDAVVAECDANMKAALTKAQLEGVSKLVGPRIQQGYDALHLGELNQKGYVVHLWRLRFKDGKDDILATVSVKDGKAGGFYLR